MAAETFPKTTHRIVTSPEPVDARPRDYLTALVQAWEPSRVAVTTYESLKVQGHKPPQVEVGWLTYIRNDIDVDTTVLDEQITITEADTGRYLAVGGTPEQPDLNHVMLVRKALGYPAG